MIEVANEKGRLGFYDPLDGEFYSELKDMEITEADVYPKFPETELYLELTEACNMNCPGCAVGVDRIKALPDKKPEEMSENLLKAVLSGTFKAQEELRLKNPKSNRVIIKYAGGEPLLTRGRKLITKARDLLDNLKKEYPNLEFEEIILTNGLLLDAKAIELIKACGIFTSVSLWDLDGNNDPVRGMPKGFNSAEKVLTGVRRLVEAGLPFNINHVVSPQNADNLAEFTRRMWDINSNVFVGRDWAFPSGKKEPIPVAIQFLRPPTKDAQIMIRGLKEMFKVATDLLRRGIEIPGLEKIDYLRPFGNPTAFACGSGINYVVAGPKGVTNCHENLFDMEPNLSRVFAGENLLEIVKKPEKEIALSAGISKNYGHIDQKIRLTLALHGGGGCPREKHNARYTRQIYAGILPSYLAFEAERQQIFVSRRGVEPPRG